jgi:arginase
VAGPRSATVGPVNVLLVPYHLDEPLPLEDLPTGPDHIITVEMRGGGPWQRVTSLQVAIADAVAVLERPVVVAADCTAALGVVAGLQRQGLDPAVIWFDAHGDLHTPESTTSGYLPGMPLRMLLGDGDATVARATGLRPVPADRVMLVDARDLDPAEAEFLATSPIERAAVSAVPVPDGPIYLHIDLDVIDGAMVAGLRFPTPDGPSLAAVRDAALRLLATGRVAALTLACGSRPGQGAAAAVQPLVDALLEGNRLAATSA